MSQPGNIPSSADRTLFIWESYDPRNDPIELRNRDANSECGEFVADLKRQPWQTRRNLNAIDRKYLMIRAIIEAAR